jgi:hypothetical protein
MAHVPLVAFLANLDLAQENNLFNTITIKYLKLQHPAIISGRFVVGLNE